MRPEVITFPPDAQLRAMVREVTSYPYHWHNALEIVYVLQGQATVGVGAATHLLNEKDILVINPEEIHRIDRSSRDNKLLLLQIDAAFYRGLHPDHQYSVIYCCSPYYEAQAPEKYRKLKGHLAALMGAFNEKPHKNQEENVRECLGEMLSYMAYSFDYLRFGPGSKAFDEKQVQRNRKMYQDILKSPPGKLGLKNLAGEAGISLYHLSHDIKDKFGHTFQGLLQHIRGEKAAKLLLGTDKRIAKISAESGFSDPKYLIKHFKLSYHCTPSEFRKKYRADEKTLASRVRYHDYPLAEAGRYLEPSIGSR